ncbi:hypothetical protein QE152_g9531 [Popillia japonica]|uniref:Uncharacterized protein n=1 Tax=Popillia japonica TaxID=7064 RepID=A0AAW1LY57_POPJA
MKFSKGNCHLEEIELSNFIGVDVIQAWNEDFVRNGHRDELNSDDDASDRSDVVIMDDIPIIPSSTAMEAMKSTKSLNCLKSQKTGIIILPG